MCHTCRPRGQRWVLYGLEPVSYSGRNINAIGALFDVSTSYSPHSHILVQYGRTVPLPHPAPRPRSQSPTQYADARRATSPSSSSSSETETGSGSFERFVDTRAKQKLAYAVISRCHSWFDRLGFIRKLQAAVGEEQVRRRQLTS